MDLLLPVARWIGSLGLAGLVGAATFQAIIRLRLARHHSAAAPRLIGRARAGAFISLLLILASLALKLLGQLQALVDPGEAVTRELFDLAVLQSSWGHSWRIQAGVAVAALAGVLLLRNTWALVVFAVAAVAVAPLTGHAVEHPWGRDVGIALHGFHALGAGVWLGTLAMVLGGGYAGTRALPEEDRHRLIADLVHAYSPVALTGVAVIIAAGLAMTWTYVDPLSGLWSTGYGRVLLLKIVLLAGTAGLGAYNWRRVRPRLGEAASSAQLYRSATLELVLGALVLGATAVLVAMAAPGLE